MQSQLNKITLCNNFYKVYCSQQFPSSFSLPRACPCCMLCATCVKNVARDELLLLDYCEDITNAGWDALSNVLCNKSSIDATFNSNHTLERVIDGEDESLPSDLRESTCN